MKGEMLLLTGHFRSDAAKESLFEAIRVSRQLDAKSLELRAATSLANVLKVEGKRKEAHALVGKDAHLYPPDSRSSPASQVFDVGTRDCLATKSSSWRGSRLEQEQGKPSLKYIEVFTHRAHRHSPTITTLYAMIKKGRDNLTAAMGIMHQAFIPMVKL